MAKIVKEKDLWRA